VGLVLGGLALAATPGVRRVLRSWPNRVAVEGPSMAPTLVAGDWLLVDPDAFRPRAPGAGELVLVPDPRRPDRLLVKRVATVLADGRLELRGDAPETSTDSRDFGPVAPELILGRPWARYWPARRAGRIR
jgi:nickel-type superoxide dismutase maturation protease